MPVILDLSLCLSLDLNNMYHCVVALGNLSLHSEKQVECLLYVLCIYMSLCVCGDEIEQVQLWLSDWSKKAPYAPCG